MKKTYITPATAIFEMRHENVIATTIPKDNSGEGIGDTNQDGFDFAPKDEVSTSLRKMKTVGPTAVGQSPEARPLSKIKNHRDRWFF